MPLSVYQNALICFQYLPRFQFIVRCLSMDTYCVFSEEYISRASLCTKRSLAIDVFTHQVTLLVV